MFNQLITTKEAIMSGITVHIAGTDDTATLSIIDPQSGTNWVQDLLGNAGIFGLAIEDGGIAYEDETYTASADTVAWWQEYINGWEATQAELAALEAELDTIRFDPEQGLDGGIIIHNEYYRNLPESDMEDERGISQDLIAEIRAKYLSETVSG
jgi:hypothetical protein